MANSVKYNTSAESLALNTGYFWIGTGDVAKGPTSVNGFYSAINPSNIDNDFADGYTIYQNKASQGPSIMVASDDAELITITNKIIGSVFTTVAECLDAWVKDTDGFVLNSYINPIITEGLKFYLDSSLVPSYPRNGAFIYDLGGDNKNMKLTDSTFLNKGIEFDGTATKASGSISTINVDQNNTVLEVLFKPMDLSQKQAIFTDAYGPEYGIWVNGPVSTTYRIYGYAYTGGGALYSGVIEIGRWYHVVLNIIPGAPNGGSEDPTYRSMYVNGELIGSRTSNSGNGLNDQPFSLGYDRKSPPGTPSDSFFSGSIDSVKIYYGQHGQAEVNQNYYQAPIVTDDLILALDPGNLVSYENGSTTTYSLVGTNTGTLTGGVAFDGGNGGIWEFDGNDDRIESFSNSVQPATITIEFWKKWTSVADDWLIGNQTSSPTQNNYGWYARIDYPSYNFFVRFGIGSTSRSITYNPIVLNEWTHVVATYDPTSEGAKLYWNGELVGTNTNAGALDYTNVLGLEIGGANDGSRDTPGPVGPVRIYDRVLTAGEVAQNYGAEKGRFSNVSIAPQA